MAAKGRLPLSEVKAYVGAKKTVKKAITARNKAVPTEGFAGPAKAKLDSTIQTATRAGKTGAAGRKVAAKLPKMLGVTKATPKAKPKKRG